MISADTPVPVSAIRLSILIVNWNTRELLAQCIDSICRYPPAVGCEVVVVDNASTDGSVAMVRERYPDVVVIENTENRGFAAAMGRVGWMLYRRRPDGFARAYAAAGLAGLLATLASGMLGDWFLPFVYNIGLAGMRSSILFWVFMGGMLALYAAHSTQGLIGEDPK